MKKLLLKSTLYVVLVLLILEGFVRIFHLYTDTPKRYIDTFGVEKSLPNQKGFAVTGNRNQNFSEYNINDFGFNSANDFKPTNKNTEIALIGDSFVEGFHQNYFDSTGKKLEDRLSDISVFEYGYSGYDLANQLFLVQAYKTHFEKIDYLVFYLKYENDLDRDNYTPNHERISLLNSTVFKIRNQIKLLAYASAIGIVDPIKNAVVSALNRSVKQQETPQTETETETETETNKDLKRLENFKSLVKTFNFNKHKMFFLLDSETTPTLFLNYCNTNGYGIIDFNSAFKKSETPPTLIYDMHWNNHGRDLIAEVIANYFKKNLSFN